MARRAATKRRPRRSSANASPLTLEEADRIAAVLSKVEADLEALARAGIDAITSPVTQASFLLLGAQEALRQREERYRLAIRATGCVIWDWDLTTGWITWAGNMEQLFGCCPEGNLSTTRWWKERVHPEDYRHVRDHFYSMKEQRLHSSGEQRDEPWAVTYRLRRADGSYITVQGIHSLCNVYGGTALRIIGAITDITQRKIDEDNLRRSEANLARAQRLTLLGSFDFDGASGKVRLSEEGYRVLGVDRATFIPTVEAIRNLINPVDLEKLVDLRQLIGAREAGDATAACDFRMLSTTGEVRIVRRECDPLFDAAGRISGFFGTFQDITRSHAAEQQRRELEEHLRHAQKMEALGTLAGGIAHDLNNTLVPVIALPEVIRRRLPEDSADRTLLEIIRQSGERARDLVKHILTFSRRQTPDRREIDLEALLRQTMRMIRASVLTCIQIHEQIEKVPLILADMAQMHQVIVNLASNAAEAIGAAIGTITFELAPAEDGASFQTSGSSCGWIRLSVRDTGCGMDDGKLKRIFEPFFTTKEVGQGSGLGLSVVHGIIAAHGGRIEARSQPGKGTCFDIFLPALELGTTDINQKGVDI